MKKMLISIAIICLLMTSCVTYHHGAISSSAVSRTVKYQDIAIGVSQINKFWGFGGVSKDALVLEARREMTKNRPLGAKEQYLNFTVDFKYTFWPIVSQTKVTMCADVVSFSNDSTGEVYSTKYKDKLLGKSLSNELFAIGDSVIFNKTHEGVIISIEDVDIVRVLYKSKSDKNRTKRISINKIYATNKSFLGLTPKTWYTYSSSINSEQKNTGYILGLGLKSLMVKNSSNYIDFVDYKNK
ncbi:MAG TPA: DUF6567 family protein [Paludibacter sp.]|nr:DUF6567 family protein [Paludibacter sp.]